MAGKILACFALLLLVSASMAGTLVLSFASFGLVIISLSLSLDPHQLQEDW